LHDGKIKVVKVDFALKSEFVIRFEEIKGKCCSGAAEGSRVPAHPEQLPVTLVPWGASVTATENNPNFVTTVNIDYGEGIRRGPRGTRVAVVAKVACKSKRMEGGPVEESVLPVLSTA
jgi:hypothetical protein